MNSSRTLIGLLSLLGALSCAGKDGAAGKDGSSCTVEEKADGSTTISCSDGKTVTLRPSSNGLTSLVRLSAEAAGTNCAEAGQRIEYGVDDDANGTLETTEVDGTVWVCNGQQGVAGTAGTSGTPGTAGAAGANSLFAATPEAVGSNCAQGGTRLDYGVDDDRDGALASGEIDGTLYVCDGLDGTNGTNGLNSLINSSAEAAGTNCPSGGHRLEHGLDDNGNGTLDPMELDGTIYVCDGAAGLVSLVKVTPEAAGTNCPSAGQRMDWGLDDDADGVLQLGEIDGTSFVCNGKPGTNCGNGVLEAGEEVDPPTSPFTTISIDPLTCRWDFTSVRQLYCNGTWTWDSVAGCQQADADMFCMLKRDNVLSTATSWTTSTAIDAPGFNGNQNVTGVVLNVSRGVTITNGVRYKDASLLTDGSHGAGSVILDPVCTNP